METTNRREDGGHRISLRCFAPLRHR
jgi:hypothetical protein